jgi:hypothetical protein
VTIDPGTPREVWIRVVPPEDQVFFRASLSWIDKNADGAIVLLQARVNFWPFGPGGDSLDVAHPCMHEVGRSRVRP